ncbi:MAG TPA: SDR family oxidoreductase [Chitinophagaceae bacterium]|nr:SDR family oxidoreductase [Chitinophagaceae bacterium]
MLDFTNKTVIITGGGSGIGKAASLLFAKQGATVHIIELNQQQADDTVAMVKKNGGNAMAHLCDVCNQQQVGKTLKEIGKVDVLVNNAGIAHIGKADTTNEIDFDRIFNVNVKGYYNCMHEAIPLMKATGKGVILNVCSVAALTGIAERFAYSMSKGAVYSMTLSVAKDYLQDNIRCNCISPARIHTPFVDDYLQKNYPGKEKEMYDALAKTQPIGRMGTTEEVASLILFLCSDEASFITGCDYPVDGGFLKLNT